MNLLEIRFPNLEVIFVLYQDDRVLGSRQLCTNVISSPEPPLLLYSGWGNVSDPRRCTKGSRPLGTRLTAVIQSLQQER